MSDYKISRALKYFLEQKWEEHGMTIITWAFIIGAPSFIVGVCYLIGWLMPQNACNTLITDERMRSSYFSCGIVYFVIGAIAIALVIYIGLKLFEFGLHIHENWQRAVVKAKYDEKNK